MITAFLLVVATPHVIRKLDSLLRINVLGETSFAVAVRASMPGADALVGRVFKILIIFMSKLFQK